MPQRKELQHYVLQAPIDLENQQHREDATLLPEELEEIRQFEKVCSSPTPCLTHNPPHT